LEKNNTYILNLNTNVTKLYLHMKSGGQLNEQISSQSPVVWFTVSSTVRLLGCVQRRSLYWVLNMWISSLRDSFDFSLHSR
jgi:hypothetical protein